MKNHQKGITMLQRLFSILLFLAFATPLAQAAHTPTADFTDNGDGTVTHITTGLTWKRCAEGMSWTGSDCTGTATAYTWSQAMALSGGWTLPTVEQLRTIINTARTTAPIINTTIFPSTPSTNFWSASTNPGDSSSASIIDFSCGCDGFLSKMAATPFVRLVRSVPTPTPTPAPIATPTPTPVPTPTPTPVTTSAAIGEVWLDNRGNQIQWRVVIGSAKNFVEVIYDFSSDSGTRRSNSVCTTQNPQASVRGCSISSQNVAEITGQVDLTGFGALDAGGHMALQWNNSDGSHDRQDVQFSFNPTTSGWQKVYPTSAPVPIPTPTPAPTPAPAATTYGPPYRVAFSGFCDVYQFDHVTPGSAYLYGRNVASGCESDAYASAEIINSGSQLRVLIGGGYSNSGNAAADAVKIVDLNYVPGASGSAPGGTFSAYAALKGASRTDVVKTSTPVTGSWNLAPTGSGSFAGNENLPSLQSVLGQ